MADPAAHERYVAVALAEFALANPAAERTLLEFARLLTNWPGGVTLDSVERAEHLIALRTNQEKAA